MMNRQKLSRLLKLASMTTMQWSSKVVRSTSNPERRVAVRSGGVADAPLWGDCVSLQFYTGKHWEEIVLSPSRARLVAELLIDCAERIEKDQPSSKSIDTRIEQI